MDAVKHGWNRIGIGHAQAEADYRLHLAHTYPGTNYNDLARLPPGALRAEGERGRREGKPATWDEMKAALHHGWDRMKD